MATTVTTNETQVLKRTWNDLDPKVRNAADVWILTVATGVAGIVTKAISPIDELYLLIPVTLAVITAYVTTSKHKQLIIGTVDAVDNVVHSAAPIFQHDARTAAVADIATVVADDVKNAVDPAPATPDENAETQVLTPNPRFSAILGNLPSSSGKPSVADPVAIVHPNGTVTGSTPVQAPAPSIFAVEGNH
jgi:hypothetical protein